MTHLQHLRPGALVRIRNERWRVMRQVRYGDAAVLDVAGCGAGRSGFRAQFLMPAELVQPLRAIPAPKVVRPSRWRHAARAALAGATARFDSLRTAARGAFDVIPYQLEPALAAVRGLAPRLLIADEVGLGKTIQAGLIVSEVLSRSVDAHALILCPAALRDQWRDELASRFGLAASVLHSAAISRGDHGAPDANPWWATPVVIASIDYVKRPEVIRALEPLVWDTVVFDEAHGLAGPSDRSAAARALGRRARIVVLLSATPHSGDDDGFARLCGTGALPGDAPLLVFRRTRDDAGIATRRKTRWLRVRLSPEELQTHRLLTEYATRVWRDAEGTAHGARLAMCVLLKRASSSAASLARSVERRLALLARPESASDVQLALPFGSDAVDAEPLTALATPGLSDAGEERVRLESILAAARHASAADSKIAALVRLLRRTSEPAIVFTEYRDTLAHIADRLGRGDAVLLHGGLTPAERREALLHFTTGRVRILLATDAASEGLNLHHRCRMVVNIELPWTPSRLEQRIGRVDRIGQRACVHAVHLVGRRTIEEQTVVRLAARAERARSAIVGGPVRQERETDIGGALLAGAGTAADSMAMADALEPPGTGRCEPAITITRELEADAVEEAGRIVTARALSRGGPVGDSAGERPLFTRLSAPRSRARPPAHYWVYRAVFLGKDEAIVWSTVKGVVVLAQRRSNRRVTAIRDLFERERHLVEQAIDATHRAAIESLRSAVEGSLPGARRRLHDIAFDLARTRGRLAALQPGLFDRRAERSRSSQFALLDAALERCTLRLTRLEALRDPIGATRELVFAVSIE